MTAETLDPSRFQGVTITVDPAARALEVDDVSKVFRQGPGIISRLRGKTAERKRVVAVDHPTPLAFPLLVDISRAKLSSEKLADRVRKMTQAAERPSRPGVSTLLRRMR